MTVDPTTGLVTWTTDGRPARRRRRSLLDVYDPSGSFTPQQFLIQVAGGSHAPVIGPLPSQVSGQEGQPLVLTVTATDPDGRPLVYWADNLPGGAVVRPDHPHPALEARLRPGRHLQRRDVLRQRRREHGQHQRHALDRRSAPPPPQLAAPPDQTVREGDHLRFTLQGSDADGGPVTYSSAALPANATLDPNTGVFDWPIGYDQAGTADRAVHRHQRRAASRPRRRSPTPSCPPPPRRSSARSRAGRSTRGSRSRSPPSPSTRTTRRSCCRRGCPTARSRPTRPRSRPSPTA